MTYNQNMQNKPNLHNSINMYSRNPYQELSCAVVEQAISDYRKASRALQRFADNIYAPEEKPQALINAEQLYNNCVSFFKGEYIGMYCSISGEFILTELEEQEWSG